jgi:hypothetical protein|tara:strand:+ start:1653 stop:2162 length:510 start_codon:yes stop_codon:yes gene_type:complete
MERKGHTEDTKFFIGTEVEHSPAYGQKTLFVIGPQNPKEILARALNNNCPHIYLGANQSYMPCSDQEYKDWDFVLTSLLKEDIWVTLDFDVSHAEEVLEGGMVEYDTFIPMISVKLPYINQFNYNATLKLDDKDFKATNPGVWSHSLHKLQDRKVFTDWSKYTKDEIID